MKLLIAEEDERRRRRKEEEVVAMAAQEAARREIEERQRAELEERRKALAIKRAEVEAKNRQLEVNHDVLTYRKSVFQLHESGWRAKMAIMQTSTIAYAPFDFYLLSLFLPSR